jgi:hypothetical protein
VRNTLKKLFKFYVKYSIHVALSVVALAKISIVMAEVEGGELLLIFIFFAALSAYNFIKFFSDFRPQNFTWKITPIRLLTASGFLVSLSLLFSLPIAVLLMSILGGFLVVAYTVPFHSKLSNWRSRKGWKQHLVVLSWLCLTVGMPLALAPQFEFFLFLYLCGIQGTYIFVALLPFEIGDLSTDASNLQTLPQRFGVLKTKILGLILLVIAALFSCFTGGVMTPFGGSTLLIFFILGVLLFKSHPKQSFYYSRFWVESLPLFWWVCFFVLFKS